ncbi:putative DNA damage repair protein [Trypanosoma rangeli]|uniref:Putative DNA damage repair protein n=1 Tax=Trypanosoma rangeli TaxID=5698 RepID=A0A422NAZ8_TRYRA|nr:putative DNA damage repair protein [Trypanosoma rangeli]RNF02657.1 putative DNA damage repair protein [Trypanosoma rangeli]|eukprot:RNF02657.1 putative DNA damage repair protein [Trypanosoma rangeli]
MSEKWKDSKTMAWACEQVNSLRHFQQHSRLHFIGQWKTRAHDIFKAWFAAHPSWNHGALAQQVLFAHIDMDAFFCSVALAKEENAHLRDKPVCIAAGKGNSDISSSNYIARSFGVRAGMYVNAAKEVCPDLQVLSYDLPRCEEVIKCLYRILFELSPDTVSIAIEVYSIDDVMIAFDTDNHETVKRYCVNVLHTLESATNCTASCGIGPNIMLARIATQYAKPNGVYFIPPQDVSGLVAQLPFNEIHGVGECTMAKLRPLLQPYLKNIDISSDDVLCCHVQKLSKQQLQRALGQKSGENFFNLCRGTDTRQVCRTGDEENRRILGKKKPSSISCSMNYAVRPLTLDDVWSIVKQLLEVVCNKMERGGCTSSGLRVTLLERHPLHPKETQKFMGRGRCVEFHIPIAFETPLKSSALELMLSQVKDALAPLLVFARQMTDEERARELGLKNDADSKIIWTVSLKSVSEVVVSDIRGMTIQATGLHAVRGAVGERKRSCGEQLALVNAFSRGMEGKRQSSVVLSSSSTDTARVVESTFELSVVAELMDCEVDEVFIEKWKKAVKEVSVRMDYTAAKALLRVAAFQCTTQAAPCDFKLRIFQDLVAYANTLLPVPVAFA